MDERRALVEVEAPAVARGMVPALVVAGVVAGGSRLLGAADERTGLAAALVLLALVGLGAGGRAAARACARNPLVHAALAALGAIAVLSGVGVAGQLASGDPAHWPYVGVWALLALAAGLCGGLSALHGPRRRAVRRPSHQGAGR